VTKKAAAHGESPQTVPAGADRRRSVLCMKRSSCTGPYGCGPDDGGDDAEPILNLYGIGTPALAAAT
jgi:hypothetical protein